MSAATGRATSGDLVSLGERMGFMQALRLVLAAVVMAVATLAPDLVAAPISELTLALAVYLLCSAGMETLRRMRGIRGLRALSWMLVADGLFVAWAMYASGGTQSPLRFLAYLHIIAVTLAASYRTGLKIALWHSLLFFVVFYSQASGWPASAEPPATGPFTRASVLNVLALWLVAFTTAAFSAVNERQLRKRRNDFSALAQLAADLQDCRTPAEVTDAFSSSTRNAFDVKHVVVITRPDGEPQATAVDPHGGQSHLEPSSDESILDVMDNRATLMRKKIDEKRDPGLARLMPFARNVALIPLVAENEAIGVAVIEFGRGLLGLERRVVSMLEQFASHTSLALRNAWLLEQIESLARTDPLTGLANRRTFQETLIHELSRARRTNEPVSVVILDVDHFKALNDRHGHLVGDEVLKEVAGTLRAAARDFDTVARYGGEEFTVILPACPVEASIGVADRLRQLVELIEDPQRTTVSAGVATFPFHGEDPETLLRAADAALYESKRLGRNRVTSGPREVPAVTSDTASA